MNISFKIQIYKSYYSLTTCSYQKISERIFNDYKYLKFIPSKYSDQLEISIITLFHTLLHYSLCILYIACQAEGTRVPSRIQYGLRHVRCRILEALRVEGRNPTSRFTSLPERANENIKHFITTKENRTHETVSFAANKIQHKFSFPKSLFNTQLRLN